jgi:Domain of unknown function (DUF4219)
MSSGINMAQFPAPMLTGNNYGIWKVKMETLLLSEGLWDIVEDGYTTYDVGHQLTEHEKKELKEKKDERCYSTIPYSVRGSRKYFLTHHQ